MQLMQRAAICIPHFLLARVMRQSAHGLSATLRLLFLQVLNGDRDLTLDYILALFYRRFLHLRHVILFGIM